MASWDADPASGGGGGGGGGSTGAKKGGDKKSGKKGGKGGKKKKGARKKGKQKSTEDSVMNAVPKSEAASLLDVPAMLSPKDAIKQARAAAIDLARDLDALGVVEGVNVRRVWAGARAPGEPMVPEDQTERWMDMMGEDVDEALLDVVECFIRR